MALALQRVVRVQTHFNEVLVDGGGVAAAVVDDHQIRLVADVDEPLGNGLKWVRQRLGLKSMPLT